MERQVNEMIKKIDEVQELLLTGETSLDYVKGFLDESDKYLLAQKDEVRQLEQSLKNLRGVYELKKSLDSYQWFKKIWQKH